VTSVMKKDVRTGKVFVDWSQNSASKTTIAPYSLRGRHLPTVAAPRTWAELDSPDLAHLLFHEVLVRLARDGDLFVPATARPIEDGPTPVVVAATRRAERVSPMLATLASEQDFPTEQDWVFEMKWDGVRSVCCLGGGEVRLFSRTGRDDTATYPEVVEALRPLADRSIVLDGEIVAVDDQGRPRFGLLQSRINLVRPGDIARARRGAPARLMLFDLMSLDGRSLVQRPYEERRELLTALIPTDLAPSVQVPPSFEGDLASAMETSRLFQLEGVVGKRRGSRYLPGRRSGTWLKVKHHRMQEVVVGGWRSGEGRRAGGVGALFLGLPTTGGLHYVGRVGTGFSDRQLDDALTRLAPLARGDCPFIDLPGEDARDGHWVTPELVGEVEYAGWSNQGRLWHPSWRGWRDDRAPSEVRPED